MEVMQAQDDAAATIAAGYKGVQARRSVSAEREASQEGTKQERARLTPVKASTVLQNVMTIFCFTNRVFCLGRRTEP